MNIRPRPGETAELTFAVSPNSGPFRKAYFLPWGCSCPRPIGAAFGTTEGAPALTSLSYLLPLPGFTAPQTSAPFPVWSGSTTSARTAPTKGRLLLNGSGGLVRAT